MAAHDKHQAEEGLDEFDLEKLKISREIKAALDGSEAEADEKARTSSCKVYCIVLDSIVYCIA